MKKRFETLEARFQGRDYQVFDSEISGFAIRVYKNLGRQAFNTGLPQSNCGPRQIKKGGGGRF